MVISYQKEGGIENRAPRTEHIYYDPLGEQVEQYLVYLKNVKQLRPATILNTEKYLYRFYMFLRNNNFTTENISFTIIEQFHREQAYSLPSRHNSNSAIRLYLRYLYEEGSVIKDFSIYVAKDNYLSMAKVINIDMYPF